MKNCPFCDGKAELIKHQERYRDNYYTSPEVYFVFCKECKTRGKESIIKSLANFTKYSCEDFRNNPILRAKEEDRYDEYLEKIKQETISYWNRRIKEPKNFYNTGAK